MPAAATHLNEAVLLRVGTPCFPEGVTPVARCVVCRWVKMPCAPGMPSPAGPPDINYGRTKCTYTMALLRDVTVVNTWSKRAGARATTPTVRAKIPESTKPYV